MKLAGREAARFCKNPDHELKGALIHGPDAGTVSVRRRELTASLLGEAPDDLRQTQLQVADVRKDASLLDTELKARGFFPGRRVVIVEGVTDGMSKVLGEILATTDAEDAFLILTAGVLPGRSSLRKLFENDRALAGIHLFQETPNHADIEDMLRSAGLAQGVSPDGIQILAEVAQDMDYGSFIQLIEIIALYGIKRQDALSADDISSIIPVQQDAEIDRFIDAVVHGNPSAIGPILSRLEVSGTKAVGLLIALQRQFRQIHMVSSASGGPEAGLALVKPPLWGARKTAMQSLVRRWRPTRLEQAIQILFETDASVRSSTKAPEMAVVERCALRLAMMARGSG